MAENNALYLNTVCTNSPHYPISVKNISIDAVFPTSLHSDVIQTGCSRHMVPNVTNSIVIYTHAQLWLSPAPYTTGWYKIPTSAKPLKP